MKTKFGVANIDGDYYRIASSKEGNHNKLLHRLIFEDFYGYKIPKGFVVHHKNGNKLDNCILNLQLLSVSEHHSLHHKNNTNNLGKKFPLETKIKISQVRNTTGYFRVSKHKDNDYKQGFGWTYTWEENGKKKSLESSSIDKLKERVIAKGLDWIEFEEVI